MLLAFTLLTFFTGCSSSKHEQDDTQLSYIGNPWSDWTSIEEAENATGFSFGLPEVISGSYTAVAFRTLNSELIEIIYRDGIHEVCVRKQAGEGQDISGDYNEYETCTESNFSGGTMISYHNSDNNASKQLIHYNGYSWSLVAPNGYWGDSNQDFLHIIAEQSP